MLMKMKQIRKENLNFAIDVSGQPYSRVIVGLIAYDKNHINRVRKDFNKQFPRFLSKKRKGSTLKSHELTGIIKFMNSKSILMRTINFTTSDWERHREQLKGRTYFAEKMYALLYFRILKTLTLPGHHYSVTLCNEQYLNIDRLLITLRRLAKANRFFFDLSISSAKFNQDIKLADYVAAGYRKVPLDQLQKYSNYKVVRKNISQRDLNKAFK